MKKNPQRGEGEPGWGGSGEEGREQGGGQGGGRGGGQQVQIMLLRGQARQEPKCVSDLGYNRSLVILARMVSVE